MVLWGGECSVLSHFAILGVAVLGVLDGLLVQALGPVREVDLQGGIAVLALQIVHHLAAVGRGRIQLEGVLPLRDPAGIPMIFIQEMESVSLSISVCRHS